MDTTQLIKENNRKRKMLTTENEKYYSDMMIYIRLQLMISEEKTEEVLVELLDHVLDGQRDGKTAEEIFGDDVQAYADEIIEQLPREERKSAISFLTGIAVELLSWVLITRGVIYFVFSQFREVDTTVYAVNALIMGVIIAVVVIFGVLYILNMIKKSLFQHKPAELTVTVKGGIFGAGAFIIILIAVKLLPSTGPVFDFPWWMSLGIGSFLWLITAGVKKLSKNK